MTDVITIYTINWLYFRRVGKSHICMVIRHIYLFLNETFWI